MMMTDIDTVIVNDRYSTLRCIRVCKRAVNVYLGVTTENKNREELMSVSGYDLLLPVRCSQIFEAVGHLPAKSMKTSGRFSLCADMYQSRWYPD